MHLFVKMYTIFFNINSFAFKDMKIILIELSKFENFLLYSIFLVHK